MFKIAYDDNETKREYDNIILDNASIHGVYNWIDV